MARIDSNAEIKRRSRI